MKHSKQFIELCEEHAVDPEGIPEITSFEDACKALNIDPNKLPVVDGILPVHQKRIIADYKLSVIADALRSGQYANYTNSNEWKYFPYFIVRATKENPSGVGLSFHDVASRVTHSAVGVRLCFPTADMAEYFGKQFLDLHTDHHLLT